MDLLKKICLLGFLCWTQLALSQTPTNPLDIEGREPDIELLQDSTFRDAIQSIQSTSPSQSSTSTPDNPFDVSHIPLKKTEQVQKKYKRDSRGSTSTAKTKTGLLNFLLWVMVGLLVFFAGIMFLFRQEVFNLIKPLFNLNYLKSLNRESSGGKNPFFLNLYMFFILNLGVLIYSLVSSTPNTYAGLSLFMYIVGIIIGVYLLKHTYIYFIRWVYPLKVPLSHYGFTVLLLNAIGGVLLFPINLLMVLGPESWKYTFVVLGLVILSILYLLRLIKGFLLSSRKSSNHVVHFFLYLCGSEIAPIALVYGLVTQGF